MQLEQSGNPADAGFSGIGSVRKKLQLWSLTTSKQDFISLL
jgi:hypothetical protein